MNAVVTEKRSRIDRTPLPVPEEELISLEEFKKNFENAVLEDLGIKIML